MASRIKGITVEIGGKFEAVGDKISGVGNKVMPASLAVIGLGTAAETLVGKNAMSGFLAVMNAAPGDIDKLNNAIANCDGTAEEMAAIMQDNLGGQLTILKSQLEELAISFSELQMPAIRNIVSKIQAFVDKLNNMDESQRKAIISVGLFVAALGPFLVILGKSISGIGSAMKGLPARSTSS